MSRFLSRFWAALVFLMLVAALSVAVAEDYNDVANTNANAAAPEVAPAAEGIQPAAVQPAEGMRAPAEAPAPAEQEQPQTNLDQNNSNANL